VTDDSDPPDDEEPDRRVVDRDGGDGGDESDRDESADADAADAQSWAEPDHDSGEDGVLDPDDLDISKREGVERHGDTQYVISTDGKAIDPDIPDVRVTHDPSGGEDGEGTTTAEAGTADEGGGDWDGDTDPLAAVEADLNALSSEFALSVVARDGAESGSLQVASGDRAATLESVLRWYAARVDSDGDAAETLRSVLAETDLDLGLDAAPDEE
jgi:hypothetical protein